MNGVQTELQIHSASSRYLITLQVDVSTLDAAIGLPSLNKSTQIVSQNNELLSKDPVIISDAARKQKKWVFTMVDHMNKTMLGVTSVPIRCHWDHHDFTGVCYGCPIEKISRDQTYTYYSQIFKREITSKINDPTHQELIGYHTDGIFCSFECALAYAYDRVRDILFRNSVHLIQEMYAALFPGAKPLIPAPPFNILKAYGGLVDIENYRKNHNLRYQPTKSIYLRMFPIGHAFEQTQSL